MESPLMPVTLPEHRKYRFADHFRRRCIGFWRTHRLGIVTLGVVSKSTQP
ncbi:MAG: hypothetical protein R3C26_26665 [Calditrichia bacterium]